MEFLIILEFYYMEIHGTGKTSIIKAIASYFDFNICTINKNSLKRMSLMCPYGFNDKRNIYVIEDVDCIETTHKRDKINNNDNSNFSLSDILNTLDGLNTNEGNIIILTTNHKEFLDNALIRPRQNRLSNRDKLCR